LSQRFPPTVISFFGWKDYNENEFLESRFFNFYLLVEPFSVYAELQPPERQACNVLYEQASKRYQSSLADKEVILPTLGLLNCFPTVRLLANLALDNIRPPIYYPSD
jgi:hypothetical protein